MADLLYILTIIYVTFCSIDLFLALLYTIPILFLRRFQHSNNMFILNICMTIIASCIYFITYFLFCYYDILRLYLSEGCVLAMYAYHIAGISIPFSFVTFTIHRFCSIKYHTKVFFKTKWWIVICISGQWISEFIIALPFLYKQRPYCFQELWMQIYTLIMAVFVPSSIITILNIFIFAHVRASTRRVQPQNNPSATTPINYILQPTMITRREILLLRQMIFTFLIFITGWAPIYFTIILSYFIDVHSLIISACTMLSQLCILTIIINLFIYNHELREYLLDKIRLHL